MGEREVLAEAAEVVAKVGGHAGDARDDRVTRGTRFVPIQRGAVAGRRSSASLRESSRTTCSAVTQRP